MFWGKYRKSKSFSIAIDVKRLQKIYKDGNESVATVSSRIKFIDSARFVTNPLSNLLNNLAEAIHKIKYKDCDRFLE